MEMKHDAGLDRTAMNAVPEFRRVEQIAHVDDVEPGTVNGKHAEPNPQITAQDVDELRLPAMRIEDDDAAAPGAVHALGQIEPEPRQRFVRDAERPRKGNVLVGFADILSRQDEQIDITR